MTSDLFKNIVTYQVKPQDVKDWDFFKELILEYHPNFRIKQYHKTIFDSINKLYKNSKKSELQCLHIHLPYQTEKKELDIANFITNAIRFKEIKQSLRTVEKETDQLYYFINNKIENPKNLNEYLSIHDGSLSGKSNIFNIVFGHDKVAHKSKGGKELYDRSNLTGAQLTKIRAKQNEKNQIVLDNYVYLAKILEYYNTSHNIFGIQELDLLPSVFFMCLKGMATKLENLQANIWGQYDIEHAITNKKARSLNELRTIVLNTKVNLTKIEDDESYYNVHGKSIYFELARTVVLFNTLSRRNTFDSYNYQKILEYVDVEEEYRTNIKRQLIITYEKKKVFSFIDYFKKINQVKLRYKVNTESDSVQIFPFDYSNNSLGKVQFHDIEITQLLEAFYDKLYELDEMLYNKFLSIWIFNLLSNIHNDTCKITIWNLLTNKLETTEKLLDLKKYYDLLAYEIIEYNDGILKKWRDTENLTIVIPNQLAEIKNVRKSITSDFHYSVTVCGWKVFKDEFSNEKKYLILDYRDSRYDHTLSPNILDLIFTSANISFHHISIFYKKRFLKNSKSYLETIIQPLLVSKKRRNYFGLGQNKIQKVITNLLEEIRITDAIDDQFDDIDETNYSQQFGDSIKIYFGRKSITTSKSEKIITKISGSNNYSIKRADELEDYSNIEGQKLSELYMGFNLFKDNLTDKAEIEKFKEQLGLEISENEWLWKELLRRKTIEDSFDELYTSIKNISINDKFYLVSESTFKNTYLDPKNDSLPREKRATKSIFAYLNLPKAYYRLVVRYKARKVLKSRKSNYKMELLIESLVENKLLPEFDSSKFSKWDKWIRESKIIDLEDVGIFENVKSEIETLTQLLGENIKLRKITKTEIVSND